MPGKRVWSPKKSVWDSSRTGSPALPTHYSSSRPASPLPVKGFYSPSSPRSVHRSPPRRSGSPGNVPLLSRRMQLYVTRGAALFLLVLGLLAASLLMRQAELTNRSGRKSQYPFHHHFGPGSHSVSAGSGVKDVVGVNEDLDLEGLPRLGVSRTMMSKWAQYAPWMPAGGYLAPPVGCDISQVCLRLLQFRRATEPERTSWQVNLVSLARFFVIRANEYLFAVASKTRCSLSYITRRRRN